MKIIVKLLIAFAVLLAVGALVVFLQADRLARSAVERGSTYALGVPTTLESARLGIRKGELGLKGLHVSNPPGFDSPHFMTLASGQGTLSFGSLFEDVVELPLLELEDIDVHLERKGLGSNYRVILENLERFESDEPDAAEEGRKFVIRRVEIRNVQVHATFLPVGGQLARLDAHIPAISLTDVGSGGEEVSLAEVAAIVMKAIFAAILAEGGGLPGELLNELGGALSGLGSIGEYGIEVAGKALEGVGDVLEGVGRGLEGILGGKKKD